MNKNNPDPFPPTSDFSVVLGGPLYQLMRRTRLSDDALALVHRRILATVIITWVPLLVLSLVEKQRDGRGFRRRSRSAEVGNGLVQQEVTQHETQ